jgi:hypothetical protein
MARGIQILSVSWFSRNPDSRRSLVGVKKLNQIGPKPTLDEPSVLPCHRDVKNQQRFLSEVIEPAPNKLDPVRAANAHGESLHTKGELFLVPAPAPEY